MATVAKPFKTVNRRFAIGAEVSHDDHLEPFTFEALMDRGFLTQAPPSSPAPAPPADEDEHHA